MAIVSHNYIVGAIVHSSAFCVLRVEFPPSQGDNELLSSVRTSTKTFRSRWKKLGRVQSIKHLNVVNETA